jgi:vancomycin permeability regulator SanA
MMTILIFGAAVRPDGKPSVTLRRRVETALACAEGHQEVRFIPTGAIGRHGPSEASVMADFLRKSGVPGEKIQLEETGSDTLSSARALARLLRKEASRGGPVMVATSPYHLPRCLILLRLFDVAAKSCRLQPVTSTTTWRTRWYWRLREVPALPYDATQALWLRLTRKM